MDSGRKGSKFKRSVAVPLKKMQWVILFSAGGNFSTTEWWPQEGVGEGTSPEAKAMALGQKVKCTFSGKLEKFA